MKADLTRVTFDPLKQFSSVLMQQGRVQLDADWNEQNAILLHYLRGLAADLFGPAGGPASNLGFAILPLDAKLPAHPTDFAIGSGRYYVDGIACSTRHRSPSRSSPRARSRCGRARPGPSMRSCWRRASTWCCRTRNRAAPLRR